MSKVVGGRRSGSRLVLSGARDGTVFPLVLAETLVGRIDSAQIVFEDASVSRIHARLILEAGAVVVEDLQSREGTWVNGVAVLRQALADGDEIAFGDMTVAYRCD